MSRLTDDLAAALERAVKELDHDVPANCYATGPRTGDPIQDFISCPGCAAIASAKNVLFRYNSFNILKQQIKLIEGE